MREEGKEGKKKEGWARPQFEVMQGSGAIKGREMYMAERAACMVLLGGTPLCNA